MSLAQAAKAVDAMLCIVKNDFPGERFWQLKAELLESLLASQRQADSPWPQDCHVEEVDPAWDHIRQFLPAHMRNDPQVEAHVGFLLGLWGEKLIGRVLRHFGFIP